MSPLTEEERKKIEIEEEARIRVRLKFEQKSSGLAGVLSSICPGLGQIYNGQLWKASLCLGIFLIGLAMFVFGIVFVVKGTPSRDAPFVFEESEVLEMSEEGTVVDPLAEETKSAEKPETSGPDIPRTPMVLIAVGAIGIIFGRNYSIHDAVKTAKKINGLHSKTTTLD